MTAPGASRIDGITKLKPYARTRWADQHQRIAHPHPAPDPSGVAEVPAHVARLGLLQRRPKHLRLGDQSLRPGSGENLRAVRQTVELGGIVASAAAGTSRTEDPPRPPEHKPKESEGKGGHRPVQDRRADRGVPAERRVPDVSERGQLPERMSVRGTVAGDDRRCRASQPQSTDREHKQDDGDQRQVGRRLGVGLGAGVGHQAISNTERASAQTGVTTPSPSPDRPSRRNRPSPAAPAGWHRSAGEPALLAARRLVVGGLPPPPDRHRVPGRPRRSGPEKLRGWPSLSSRHVPVSERSPSRGHPQG